MGLFDNLVENVSKQAADAAEQYAGDWLKEVTGQKKNSVTVAPAPAGTLPADAVAAQSLSSQKLILYIGIGVAVFAALALIFKKGGKK